MTAKRDKCIEIVKEDDKVVAPVGRAPYYPFAIKSGKGAIIEDEDGNKYIDLLSSAAATNVGHCHPKVVQAISDQIKNYIHYTSVYMYNKPLVELAKELIKITPGNFEKRVVFGLSGSDANDGMIKFARAYTGRSKIISFIKAYHGSTYGSLSLTTVSSNIRKKIGPMLPDVYHIPYPDCYRCSCGQKKESCSMECIKQLKEAFKCYIPPSEVAAIIIEPIQGDAGLVVPPKDYIEELYKICKDNGILFVSEEVQQGFGRTGKWFGIENFDVVPDAIIMGKSIASGMPISAIVGKEEIMKALSSLGHTFTMAANAVACRAALATIDVIREEKLLDRSLRLGQHIKNRFEEMKKKYEIIGDVRGIGLSIGVDLVEDRKSKVKAHNAAAKICYRCWEKGLVLTFFAESVLRIQPPLIIEQEQLDKALNIIEESINDYLKGNIPDEVLEIAKGW